VVFDKWHSEEGSIDWKCILSRKKEKGRRDGYRIGRKGMNKRIGGGADNKNRIDIGEDLTEVNTNIDQLKENDHFFQ